MNQAGENDKDRHLHRVCASLFALNPQATPLTHRVRYLQIICPGVPHTVKVRDDQISAKYSRPCCSDHKTVTTKQWSWNSKSHLQASVKPMPVSEFLFGWEFRFTPLASRVLLSHWALTQVIARHQWSFCATRCSNLSVGLHPKGDGLVGEVAR